MRVRSGFYFIESPRTRLRPFAPSDAEDLAALLRDADTMRFTGFRVPQSEEKIQAHLQGLLQKSPWPLGIWAAEDKQSHTFIGWFMLQAKDGTIPELGYMIAKAQTGLGYATEVAQAILSYGLDTLELGEIIARTDEENFPSIRVLEKIGMVLYAREAQSSGFLLRYRIGREGR